MAEKESGFRRQYSIFLVLSILLVGLVVVPLLSFAWRAISSSREYIEESLRERQLKTAIPAAAHIQTLMGEYGRNLASLATSFELYANEADYRQYYEGLLQRDILERWADENTLLVHYLDAGGNQFAAPGDGVSDAEKAQIESFLMPLARRALEGNAPVDSGVFFVRAGTLRSLPVPAIALSRPIHSGATPVAAVSAVVVLQPIQDSLQQYGREFTLFVTDEKGRLVFHSEASKQGQATDLANDPMVERVVMSGQFPSSTTNYNVSSAIVTCSPIPEYRWLLFSYVDRENFFAPIYQLRRTSWIWVGASILSALLIGILLARVLTKPLSDLTEVSQDLARGNFGRRAEVRIRNEIGQLAAAFNLMADEIQDYIRRVEAAAEENKQLFMNSIRAIANAIDAKDPYTRGHSERVSAYSMIIAREYGLDTHALEIMEVSSLLHDVGKIGIEDKILRKPGALTNDEFAVMKTHPSKGADILGSIPQMVPMIPGIKHHHERWSGGGYPDGLKGESVPLLARIIGVADAFDAMTTNRPYQRAMTFEAAAARINELCPAVYEPTVVEAFNRAFRRGVFARFQTHVREAKLA